jgi:predicted  nucleic acid-binding Zn-ribbon protein
MPTAAQEIAALKRAVRQLESRLDAIERPKLEDLERTVKEGFSDHNALIDVLTQGARTDRMLADQRHDTLTARLDQQHAETKALGEDFEELKVAITNGFATSATRKELADARAEIATTRIEIATMRTQVADLRTAMTKGFERLLAALPKTPD